MRDAGALLQPRRHHRAANCRNQMASWRI